MANKNILIITSSIQPIFQTAEYLANLNNVYVVYLFPGSVSGKIAKKDYPENMHLFEIDSNGFHSLTEKMGVTSSFKVLLSLFKMTKVSYDVLLTKDIDIIYPQWAIPSGFIACILNNMLVFHKIKRKPIIVTLRGSDIKIFYKNILTKPLISYSLKNSNAIISLTNDMKEDVFKENIDDKKIFVIPNGTDSSLFKPYSYHRIKNEFKLPEDSFILLYVGSLIKIKNVDLLINTVRSIKYKNLYFVIVGSGPEENHLRDITRRYRMENVFFTGKKEHGEIPEYINSADVLLLYSDSEGLPTVIQEAFSCGKPVISNSVGGVSEIVKDNVNGFLVQDLKEMKTKIEVLIKNRELLDEMSRNALVTSKNYDSSVVNYQINQVLESSK